MFKYITFMVLFLVTIYYTCVVDTPLTKRDYQCTNICLLK